MAADLPNSAEARSVRNDNGPTDMCRDQIRGSTLFLVGNVISLGITFVPHLALVRYLTTDAYGHWAYALSLVAIGKTYALGFNEAISRFVPMYHAKRDTPRMLGAAAVVVGFTLLISGFLLGTLGTVPDLILRLLTQGREPSGLLLILMFLVPLESLDLLVVNLFACFNRAHAIFWCRYIIPPGLRAIAIALVIARRSSLHVLARDYLMVEGVTLIIFAVIMCYGLRRREVVSSDFYIQLPIREIVGFALPLMLSNMIGMLGGAIPILALGYFQPMLTVAYYRVVLPVASLTTMIPATFIALYVPSASRLFASGDTSGMNSLFWETSLWMSVLALPIFLTTFCFSHPLTIFLYGTRYAPSAAILAILSTAYFFNAIFAFSDKTLKVLGKVRQVVALNVVTPIIIVVFNLLLIPRYGALGAAVATASGMVLQTALRQLALWRWGGGISLFEKKYAFSILVLGSSALALNWAQHFMPDNIYLGMTLVCAMSFCALLLLKRHLRIADTFPEVVRLPLIGRLFA